MDQEPKPESQEVPASAPEALPGRHLREAREHQGLTAEDVAERLHLQPGQVEALENDDYTHFPAAIFVSGYLRSYARLLGLDADPLVKALGQQGLEGPHLRSELTARMPPVRRARPSFSPRLRALAAIGAVVCLVVLGWSLWPRGERVPMATAPAVTTAPAVSAPSADGAAAPAPAEGVAPPSQPAAAVPPAEGPDEDDTAEEPPPATSEPMDELVLRFSGESWVEIADVTGRRMAYRMGDAPDVLRLRGLAPFDILLGNAPNVSIEYNGKPYTDIPISRTNVASFRLGGTGDEGVKKDESQKSDPAT
jgi:cytoskeleton protein RodZ